MGGKHAEDDRIMSIDEDTLSPATTVRTYIFAEVTTSLQRIDHLLPKKAYPTFFSDDPSPDDFDVQIDASKESVSVLLKIKSDFSVLDRTQKIWEH